MAVNGKGSDLMKSEEVGPIEVGGENAPGEEVNGADKAEGVGDEGALAGVGPRTGT